MSECQTKAGNQECFDKLEKLSLSLISGVIIFQIAPTQVGAEFYKLGHSGQNFYDFLTKN